MHVGYPAQAWADLPFQMASSPRSPTFDTPRVGLRIAHKGSVIFHRALSARFSCALPLSIPPCRQKDHVLCLTQFVARARLVPIICFCVYLAPISDFCLYLCVLVRTFVDQRLQGHVVVVDLVPGTPADLCGQVFAGDIIEQADGENLMGMYISDVVAIISGGRQSAGTYLCLRLLRDSAARITIRIMRHDKMEIAPKPQAPLRESVPGLSASSLLFGVIVLWRLLRGSTKAPPTSSLLARMLLTK